MTTHVSHVIKSIFERLRDEESRVVFRGLMDYLTDGGPEHIWSMLRRVSEYDRLKPRPPGAPPSFFSLENTGGPAVLYGAGGNSSGIRAFAESLGIAAAAYCDGDPRKWGHLKDGLPILSPEELLRLYPGSPVIISSPIYEREINAELLQRGLSPAKIFSSTFSEGQYFGPGFLRAGEDEIYLDAGPYDGKTILQFAEFCGGNYKKIYAMEPNPISCKMTKECIRSHGLENVSVVEAGAWSHGGSLSFYAAEGGSRLSEAGEIKIPVTTIDEVVGGGGATFIKMDIEGAELPALRGARETISRFAPRLAVCVYHKPGDFLDIPAYLLEAYPGYGFYLRCHTLSAYETVLYAVP